MAVGQWYHFGQGAPPIFVYFSGDWDVHWIYGILSHGHLVLCPPISGRSSEETIRKPMLKGHRFERKETSADLSKPKLSNPKLRVLSTIHARVFLRKGGLVFRESGLISPGPL